MKNDVTICWFGIYDPLYPRNDIFLRGLKENNIKVIECNASWKDPARYKILWKKLKSVEKDCDVIYAAYPSNVPVLLAKLVTRKPVVMDALYSMYDAVVNDRKEISWYHPRAIKLWFQDFLAALLTDYMVIDTKQHALYWARLPFVSQKKMKVIYTGVQDHIFFPFNQVIDKNYFLVSFHGLYIPLQGVDKIALAAHLLQKQKDIRFRFIGSGQLSQKVDEIITKYNLENIEQVGRMPAVEVARLSNEADVILGVFGDTEKTNRVVPNKVYEGMAMKKPVITMDTPSVREVFTDKELLLVKNTPEAIAEAILKLKNDVSLRQGIAQHGYTAVLSRYSPKSLGQELLSFLSEKVKDKSDQASIL